MINVKLPSTVFFERPYAKILIESNVRSVAIIWTGAILNHQFQEVWEMAYAACFENGFCTIISDTSAGKSVPKESKTWVLNKFVARLSGVISNFPVVVSSDVERVNFTNSIRIQTEGQFNFRYFDTYSEALEWARTI